MRGFILAAGFGTRLRPITDHIPKALVGVGGRPLLERALSFLIKQGISEIGVNAHHLADQVAEFKEKSAVPFTLFHEKDALRGTGGGLAFARDFLAAEEFFYVCNVDIVCAFNLKPLIERFRKTGWLAGLLAVPAEGSGTVFFDHGTGQLTGVPADGKRQGRGADFIGAALYRREFLDALLPGDFTVVSVWKRVRERSRGVGVLMVDKCYWRDIGTPEALAAAHFDVLDGETGLPTGLETPGCLHVDLPRKRCYPAGLPEGLLPCVGRYAWVEEADLPADAAITHSVVYERSVIKEQSAIENMIITPFGEVRFGK